MGVNCCTKQSEEGIEILRPEKTIISNFTRNYQKNHENNLSDLFSYTSSQKENPNLYSQYNGFSNKEKEKQDQQKKYSNYEYSQISHKQEDNNTPFTHSLNQLLEKFPKNTVRSTAEQTGSGEEINKIEDLKKIKSVNNFEEVNKIDDLKKIEKVKNIEELEIIEENNKPEKETENKESENKEKLELNIDNKQNILIDNQNENNSKEILQPQPQSQIQEQTQAQKENNIIYSEMPDAYQQQQVYTTTKNLEKIVLPPIIKTPIIYDDQSKIFSHISQTSPNDLYIENQNKIIQTEQLIQPKKDYLSNTETKINNINYYQTSNYETSKEIITNKQIIPSDENNLINNNVACENIIQNDPLIFQTNSQIIYSPIEPIYDQSNVINNNNLTNYDLQNCNYDDSQLLTSQIIIQDMNDFNNSSENNINYQTEPEIQYTQNSQKHEMNVYENLANNCHNQTTPFRNNSEYNVLENISYQEKSPISENINLFIESHNNPMYKSTKNFQYNAMTHQEQEKKIIEDDFNSASPNNNKSKLQIASTQNNHHNRALSEMNNYKNSKTVKSFTKENIYKKPILYSKNNQQSQNDEISNSNSKFPKNNYTNTANTISKKIKIEKSKKIIEENYGKEIDDNIIEYYKNNYVQSTDFSPDMWQYFYPKNERFFLFNKGNTVINQTTIEEIDQKYPNEIITYTGEVNLQGEKHGYGKLISASFEKEGEWRNNKFTGWGREIKNNGEFLEGKFIDGEISGKGVYKNSNDDLYIGEFSHSLKHGKGELITQKFHYKGDFYNNKINGKGIIEFIEDGNIYEGEFNDNQINGKGILKWKNGDLYEGEMRNGKLEGFGIFKSKSGYIYEGEFRNGAEEGHGKLYYPEGRVFEGTFENGKPVKANKKKNNDNK